MQTLIVAIVALVALIVSAFADRARTVVAVFTTTLMMVGILTLPIERQYFGVKVAVIRNVLSLLITFAISVVIGLAYGELG